MFTAVTTATAYAQISYTTAASDKSGLELDYQPVYKTIPLNPGAPIRVNVTNKGRSTTGEIWVGSDKNHVVTPLDLPSGTTKSVILSVPQTNQFEEFVRLSTNRGTLEARIAPGFGSGLNILYISDGYANVKPLFIPSLNGNNTGPSPTYSQGNAALLKPQEAPERASQYTMLNAVVLGSGSENLSDRAVHAIKMYMLQGGSVIMAGGSLNIVNDRRWGDYLPATKPEFASGNNISGTQTVGTFTYLKLPDDHIGETKPYVDNGDGASAAIPNLMLGKDKRKYIDSHPLSISTSVGLGAFTLFAVDPSLPAFADNEDLSKELRRLVATEQDPEEYAYGRQQHLLGGSRLHTLFPAINLQADSPNRGYYPGGYGGPYPGSTPGYPRPDNASSAFEFKPPEASIIYEILAAYVVAIFLCLWMLQKRKRAQLAWYVSPVISVGFALLTLSLAGSLYAMNLAQRRSGVLVTDTLLDSGYFNGNSQLFFNRAGDYDLKGSNLEKVSTSIGYEYGREETELEVVDQGVLSVPHFQSRPLGFYRFSYSQQVNNPPKLLAIGKVTGNKFEGKVTNPTSFIVKEVQVVADNQLFSIGSLQPGESKQVSLQATGGCHFYTDPGILVAGLLEGWSPGFQIGVDDAVGRNIGIVTLNHGVTH